MLQALALEHLPGKLMTRDNVYSMRVDNTCDAGFPTALGFEPTPVEAVVPDLPRQRHAARALLQVPLSRAQIEHFMHMDSA